MTPGFLSLLMEWMTCPQLSREQQEKAGQEAEEPPREGPWRLQGGSRGGGPSREEPYKERIR